MTYVLIYANQQFLKLVKEGQLVPQKLPSTAHLHWILVRGYPRWVSSLRPSDACGTVRCWPDWRG